MPRGWWPRQSPFIKIIRLLYLFVNKKSPVKIGLLPLLKKAALIVLRGWFFVVLPWYDRSDQKSILIFKGNYLIGCCR
jgi:hypothetical protein